MSPESSETPPGEPEGGTPQGPKTVQEGSERARSNFGSRHFQGTTPGHPFHLRRRQSEEMTVVVRCVACLAAAVLVSASESDGSGGAQVAPPRELFLSEKDQCKLLRFTSEVAKVTDAFCSGDIATILDTFLELGALRSGDSKF